MAISINDIHDYLKLTFTDLNTIDLNKKRENFHNSVLENTRSMDNYFLVRDDNGTPVVASWIFKIEAGKYAFQSPRFLVENSSSLKLLFQQIKDRFKDLKGRELICRTIHNDFHESLQEAMLSFGFRVTGERVEYKTALNSLTSSVIEESPIKWCSPLKDKTMKIDEVATLMEEVSEGDPDFDPKTDNAKECIESYLSEDGLYVELDCIQVGYLKDSKDPCCFLIAQVESSSGWSRITYMGIHPKFRGKGLGVWVQRHGIELLKKQGGTEYHGGTNMNNVGMQKVFEKNSCTIFRKLTEWKL